MKKSRFSSFSASFLIRKRGVLALSALLLSGLCACGGSGVQLDPSYEDKSREALYENGSLASESGGFNLLGGREKKKNEGLGVNGFLWRATLDTISFLPIASADPFGGIITTDWHSSESAPNERTKLNVFILDRDLRADGVKVTVFRQVKGDDGEWKDADVAPATASSLEETILTRARQLRLAQKEAK